MTAITGTLPSEPADGGSGGGGLPATTFLQLAGAAGGQVGGGGTATTESLTLRPNTFDTVTGQVRIGSGTAASSMVWDQPTLSLNIGGPTPIATRNLNVAVNVNGISGVNVQNMSAGASVQHYFTVYNDLGIGLIVAPMTSIGSGLAQGTFTGANGLYMTSGRTFAISSGFTSPFILGIHDGTLEIFRAVESGGNRTMTFHASTLIGFYGATPVAQQVVGANVNNVAVSGTTGRFDDFTNLTTYATDAAAIHATISQLCRTVTQHTVALRNLGIAA